MSNRGNAHQSKWSDEFHNGPERDVLAELIDSVSATDHLSQDDFDGPAVPTPARRAQADQEWLTRVVKALNL